MEALWPEADPDASANRLRTVLNRLKDAAGDVVVRDNRQLCLAPDVHTDVQAFTDDARRATLLAASGSREAVSAARAALARYRGDLPDDPYEPWAELPRQRLRSQAHRSVRRRNRAWPRARSPPSSRRACSPSG